MGFVVAMVYFLAVATLGNEWDFGVGSAQQLVGSSGEICGYPAREPDLDWGYAWNLLVWPIILASGFFVERLVSGFQIRQVQASASGSL